MIPALYRSQPLGLACFLVGCGSAAVGTPVPSDLPHGIELEWTRDGCRTPLPGSDSDDDGLVDGCEFVLAQAFAPLLVLSAAACNVGDGAPAGGYGFTVEPGEDENTVLIGYAPAYVQDCGWSGPKCWLRWRGGCRGHAGDSEFIGVEIQFDESVGRWATRAVFLSAHCFGASDADCRWYRGPDLNTFAWAGAAHAAPTVWVAEGKNANYPTRGRCDRGHWWFDTCERNTLEVRFPVLDQRQNLGSPLREARCLTLGELGWDTAPPGADAEAVECFGDETPFRGWAKVPGESTQEKPPRGVTPYRRYFQLLEAGPGAA